MLIQYIPIVLSQNADCKWGGGGHFAGMPTVANGMGVGVKNGENLPTS
jgi:hypothetical protein